MRLIMFALCSTLCCPHFVRGQDVNKAVRILDGAHGVENRSIGDAFKNRFSIASEEEALKKIEDQTSVLFQSPKITYPEYAKDMPLLLELRAFFQNIISKKRPLTGLAEGIAVVAVLEAAEKSIAQHGQLVEFNL